MPSDTRWPSYYSITFPLRPLYKTSFLFPSPPRSLYLTPKEVSFWVQTPAGWSFPSAPPISASFFFFLNFMYYNRCFLRFLSLDLPLIFLFFLFRPRFLSAFPSFPNLVYQGLAFLFFLRKLFCCFLRDWPVRSHCIFFFFCVPSPD